MNVSLPWTLWKWPDWRPRLDGSPAEAVPSRSLSRRPSSSITGRAKPSVDLWCRLQDGLTRSPDETWPFSAFIRATSSLIRSIVDLRWCCPLLSSVMWPGLPRHLALSSPRWSQRLVGANLTASPLNRIPRRGAIRLDDLRGCTPPHPDDNQKGLLLWRSSWGVVRRWTGSCGL